MLTRRLIMSHLIWSTLLEKVSVLVYRAERGQKEGTSLQEGAQVCLLIVSPIMKGIKSNSEKEV